MKKAGAASRRRASKRPAAAMPRSSPRRGKARLIARTDSLTVTELAELRALRKELERSARASPPRWNAEPDEVQRSVAHLVLTLVEFIRQLLERQAIRRMEARTLTAAETESVGQALMKLEETVADIAGRFGIDPKELNLDLGPAGKLM